jgi:biotin carboxyl carrier protein
MKYIVRVEDKKFEVEIPDLHARPVIAIIDGVSFEIWPEDVQEARAAAEKAAPGVEPAASSGDRPTTGGSHKPAKNGPTALNGGSDRIVRAPIPGTVISVLVAPGAEVSAGEELLVLEAMKMKNIIRAPRAGRIQTVFVATGQTVKHHDSLVEFAG